MRRTALTIASLLLFAGCSDTPEQTEAAYDSDRYTRDRSAKALTHPVGGLDHEATDRWMLGKSFFRIPWVEAPSATTARDGLGPLFSANTCIHCHPNNGAGVAVDGSGAMRRDLVLRLALPNPTDPDGAMLTDPTYGTQLSINGTHGTPFEGTPAVSYAESAGAYPDGRAYRLRRPLYRVDQLNYGPLHPETRLSPRIALALVGLGMIEAIPDAAILSREDPEDRDGDGISGKANWIKVPESTTPQLGRFTWKASSPSVRFQIANAASNDMGLTSPRFPEENCTPSQPECLEADRGFHDVDLTDERIDAIHYYLTHLKVPEPRPFERTDEGASLFESLGCATCHTPTYTLPGGDVIAPYSDFLLHDMGDALADGHRDGLAEAQEWRTPPLWGAGLYAAVSGEANYLHDGRARSIEEAILWHGGEGLAARDAFVHLPRAQRQLLIDYLGTR